MKILLDHCVPKPFRRELLGHEVRTAFEMGWSNLDNGKLLAEAAQSFDVFLTVDQNVQFQRNLANLPLPVLILVAVDNDPQTLKPYAPSVLNALATIQGTPMLRIQADGRIESVADSP